MPATLKQRIEEDVKAAMRARAKQRLAALRLVTAAIKQREVDARTVLDDDGVLAVLGKMLKQGRDSIEQFENAGRDDLAAQEAFEVALIESYLPDPLEPADLARLIDEALAACEATGMGDMGKVMALLRPQIQGRADLGAVGATVKRRLSDQ